MIERYERVVKLAVFTAVTNHVPCNNLSLVKPGNHRFGSSMRRCDYTLFIGDGINYLRNAIH